MGNFVSPEQVETWMEQPQNPGSPYPGETIRRNRHITMNNLALVYNCLDAANAETGVRFKHEIRDSNRGTPFIIYYTIKDVEIVAPCKDGHDFTEWRYDFMGGDLRDCKRCGLYEHI